jgi:hypothetical protein
VSDSQPVSGAKRALVEQALRRRREAARAATSIPPRPPGTPVPLSSTQLRMWFLAQWEPGAPTFNAARAIRLRGELDRAALHHALDRLLARHESLRTVVQPGPQPHQVALDSWSLELPVIPLPGAPSTDPLPALLSHLAREPFDLTKDLMMRASLIEIGPHDHVLLLRIHHIAADAHSDGIIFTELSELYNAYHEGRSAALSDPPLQYADYTVWQQGRLTGAYLDELVSYWRRTLAGAPERLALPADGPPPPVQRHAGAHRLFSLDRALADRLVEVSRPQTATFFMATLAAFATLLYRRSGSDDIVIGSPIANRNTVQVQHVLGFFSNTMALRLKLDGNPSFRDVLARARATALGAYAHQELPFERVVEAVAPRRDPSYNPLFQVNFRAQASERPPLQLNGLEAEQIHVDLGISRFDLALELELRPQELAGYFEYDADLFEPATVDGMVEDLSSVIEQIVAEPDAPVLAIKLPRRRSGGRSGERMTRRR